MAKFVVFKLPFPPSVNGYWRSIPSRKKVPMAGIKTATEYFAAQKNAICTRQIVSERGRIFRSSAMLAIRCVRYTRFEGHVSVDIYYHPPDDGRRRDIDNYAKGVLDAMTLAGVWVDDSQIKALHQYWCKPENPGRCSVVVSPYEEDSDNERF